MKFFLICQKNPISNNWMCVGQYVCLYVLCVYVCLCKNGRKCEDRKRNNLFFFNENIPTILKVIEEDIDQKEQCANGTFQNVSDTLKCIFKIL